MLIDAVRKIKRFVKNAGNTVSGEVIEELEKKLSLCRNSENDVTTQEYRMKQVTCLGLSYIEFFSSSHYWPNVKNAQVEIFM